jgi:predicted ATPase/DNA-binding SARP family transcriptional activator
VQLGGKKQRAVLALLLLRPGEVVADDEFLEALWGDGPVGAGAKRTLQVYVSNLRAACGRERVARRGPGYILLAGPDEVDSLRFERLVAEGRHHLAEARPAEAVDALVQALGLWRGPALADFAYEPWALNEARRLEEAKLAATEARFEAELELGRHAELVPALEALAAEHPYREAIARRLMLALYRSGRQADALDVYQATRSRLVDELGIDPGAELQALYRAILNQDPGLATPAAAPTRPAGNLPTPVSSFVGREDHLADATDLLSATRLITVTGPGGAGKTRFALELASRLRGSFADGAFWVPLATLRDPRLVLDAVAQAIGATAALETEIGTKRMLLVLDNFEQVVDAASHVAALLTACPNLTAITTSRELLRVRGEVEYALPPLSVGDGTALFCDRARIDESESIAAICSRLDGLPLAIELAAARTSLLSPEQLLERLSERLDLLKGGRDVEPRQQTLRATIAWSFDLLASEERTTFSRLGVFVGGCTLEVAEGVCDAELETIASLLDKNLVRRRDGRVVMLETIREFALGQLEASGEADAIFLRHAEWCLRLAEETAPRLHGREQSESLDVLEAEHDNLRSALSWAHGTGRAELALRLTAALQSLWYMHGHLDEGCRWFELALSASDGQPVDLRARILQGASVFAATQEGWERGQELALQALDLYRELGDQRGIALGLRELGATAVHRGDLEAAKRFYAESVECLRELDDPVLLATNIANLGDVALREGRLDEAAEYTRAALEIQRSTGNSFGAMVSLSNLGFISVVAGRDEEARLALEECMLIARRIRSTDNLGYAYEGLAAVAAARAQWELAARLLGRAEAIRYATATALEVSEQTVHEQTVVALAAVLGEDELASAVAAGWAMSDEETISLVEALKPATPA